MTRMGVFSISLAAVLSLSVGPAAADRGASGVWLTEADRKGQTALITTQPCGGALCGTITEVYSPAGKKISHPNVGKRVFWNVQATGGSTYEGRAFVPALQKDYPVTMELRGAEMRVRGCVGPVCQSQTWHRVK